MAELWRGGERGQCQGLLFVFVKFRVNILLEAATTCLIAVFSGQEIRSLCCIKLGHV